MESLQTRFGFRFFKFGWTELNENDLRVLESTESSLRSTDYSVLLNATEFLQFVVLRDFPAEIFLERPNIVRSLIAIINNSPCGSSHAAWSNLAAASTIELLRATLRDAAISTLSEIAKALLSRVRFVHTVDCFRQVRTGTGSNGAAKPDVSATSDQLSHNPWLLLRSRPRVDLLGTSDSIAPATVSNGHAESSTNLFSRHVNAHSSRLTSAPQQSAGRSRSMSLAAFALDTLNCVLTYVHNAMQRPPGDGQNLSTSTASGSSATASATRSARCALSADASTLIWAALQLVAHAVDWRVLDFATTMSFEARETSEKLETFFANLARCLVAARRWTVDCDDTDYETDNDADCSEADNSELSSSRQPDSASFLSNRPPESALDAASRYAAFTTLAHVATLAVAYLVPPDRARVTLPDELRHALVFTYLDGPFGASNPHVRSLLRAHVAALSKQADGVAADLDRVRRSIDATCRFLTIFDALLGNSGDLEFVINVRVELAQTAANDAAPEKESEGDRVLLEVDTLLELVRLARDALLCQPVVCSTRFVDALVRLCSIVHRLSGPASTLRAVRFDLGGVMLRLLASGASDRLRALAYDSTWRFVRAALSPERAALGETAMQAGASSVAFLLDRDCLYETVCFGMTCATQRVQRTARLIVERLISSQFLLGATLWSALMENLALGFAVLQTCADADSEFGRTLLRLCAPPTRNPGTDPEGEVATQARRLQTRLTTTECTRSTLRFLMSADAKHRSEAVNRLVDVLAREPDAVEKRPSFTQVDFRSLASLFLVDAPRQLNNDPLSLALARQASTAPGPAQVNVQADSMLKVLDIFASSTIEATVRRSAAEQLAIFLLDPGLHSAFSARGGLQLTLSVLQRGVLKTQLSLEPLLVPTVAILRRLLQADAALRHAHANDAPLLLALVRVLLLNQHDTACKFEVAFCLTLLLFDELGAHTAASSCTPSCTSGFVLPNSIARKYALPFVCTPDVEPASYWATSGWNDLTALKPLFDERAQQRSTLASLKLVSSTAHSVLQSSVIASPGQSLADVAANQQTLNRILYVLSLQRIRVDWQLAYADSAEQLLVNVQNELHAESKAKLKASKDEWEFERRMRLTQRDKLTLVGCNIFFALREQLFAVSNAVRHEHVLDALDQLEQLVALVDVLPAHSHATLRTWLTHESMSALLTWRAAFERFLRVAPANVADELLLGRLLRFCARALHSVLRYAPALQQLCEAVATRCGSPVWVVLVQDASSTTQFPHNAALNLLAVRVHKRLHSQCLHWFAALLRLSPQDEALPPCVAKLILTLVQTRLILDESMQFYNLAALQSALTCLMHITAVPGWAVESELTADGCVTLTRTFLKIVAAFQHGCGPDLLSSRMGRHIRIAALVSLEHTLVELLERTPLTGDARTRFVTELIVAMNCVALDANGANASTLSTSSMPPASNNSALTHTVAEAVVVDWLCTMWLHADVEMRSVSLSFAATLTRLVPDACALLLACGAHAGVRGGMLNVLLSFVLDDSEASLVRRCAAACLANLLQFLATNQRFNALPPASKAAPDEFDSGTLLSAFSLELTRNVAASDSNASSNPCGFVEACLRAFRAYFPYPFAIVGDAPLVQHSASYLSTSNPSSNSNAAQSRSSVFNSITPANRNAHDSSADPEWHLLHTTQNASVLAANDTNNSAPATGTVYFVSSSLEMPLVSTAPILEQLTNHCMLDATRLAELQLSSADLLSDLCALVHTMLDIRYAFVGDVDSQSQSSTTATTTLTASTAAIDDAPVRDLLVDSHLLVIPLKTLLDTGFLTEYTIRVAQLLTARNDQFFYATDSRAPALHGLDSLLLLYANAFRTLRALFDRAATVVESAEQSQIESKAGRKSRPSRPVAPPTAQSANIANAVLSAVLNDSKFLENVASVFEYKRLLDSIGEPLPLSNLTRFWLETMLFVQSVLFTVRVGGSAAKRRDAVSAPSATTTTSNAAQAIVLSLIDPRQFLASVLIDTLTLRVADIVDVCASILRCKPEQLAPFAAPPKVLTYDFLSTLCYTFALHRPLALADAPRSVLQANDTAYAALCRLLVTQFDALTIAVRKPTESAAMTLEYIAFSSCIRLLLAVVGDAAKCDALRAGLLESTLGAIEYDLGRLNANQLRLAPPSKAAGRTSKPTETDRIRINLAILQNLLFRCPEAKTAAVFSGLPNTLRRAWTWALLDSALMCAALDLLHVLTANAPHCGAVCRQLATVSAAASGVASPTKSAGNSPQKALAAPLARRERDRLISNTSSTSTSSEVQNVGSALNLAAMHSVFSTIVPPSYANLLACVLKQAETKWTRASAPVIVRAFGVLINLCAACECRSLLFKSNFLQRFPRLDFGAAYKSGFLAAEASASHTTIGTLLNGDSATAAAADASYASPVTAHSLLLWLKMLLNISCAPDGQQMIMKIDGIIDILVELTACSGVECAALADGSTPAIRKQDIPLRALLILKNLCKSTGCKQKLTSMSHFLNDCLLRCVQMGIKNLQANAAMTRVALVALRQLLHANQKARALLKTESTLQLLLDAFNCAAKLRAESDAENDRADAENRPKLSSKLEERSPPSKTVAKRSPVASIERLAQTLITILNE